MRKRLSSDEIVISKEALRGLIEAAEHAAFFIREYGDETFVHDQATREGHQVVDGRCNNPDCVICELETKIMEAEDLFSGEATIQLSLLSHDMIMCQRH